MATFYASESSIAKDGCLFQPGYIQGMARLFYWFTPLLNKAPAYFLSDAAKKKTDILVEV